MKTITKIIYVAIASIAVINSAKAEGYYLGGGFGYNSLSSDTDSFEARMKNIYGGTISSTQNGSVGNIRLISGLKINKQYSMELGYSKSGNIGSTYIGKTAGNTSYSGDYSSSYSGFDVSAIIRPSTLPKLNNFFVNVGIHKYDVKGTAHDNFGGSLSSQSGGSNGSGQLFGVGYDLKLNKFVDLRFNITHFNKIGGASTDRLNNFGFTLIENYN
ncbi:MAG: hypothetical protein EBS37_00620 [Betaproteobacteria bacterium]|nr:hypothetical protein [Betaproteobacteria bacterium]